MPIPKWIILFFFLFRGHHWLPGRLCTSAQHALSGAVELPDHLWARIRLCRASLSHLASTARNRVCAWSPKSSNSLLNIGSKLAAHSRYTVFRSLRFLQG